MATITVNLSDSVNYCYWTRASGGSGTISGSRTWTSTDSSDYIMLYPSPANGYRNPIWFNRSDGYDQLVVDANGNGSDRKISFTQNKYGTLNATYYAPTYTLSYDGNGATGGSTASQSGGTHYTVRSCGFYKTGYTFDYWLTGSGQRYDPGQTIGLSSDTVLYAQWKESIYTISYNANGGDNAPSDQTKKYGETITLSSDTPTWPGHTFWGWATSPARDAERAYNAGASYSENVSRILYAIWAVTASFYSKGSLSSQIIKRINDTVILPTPSFTATEGCRGWRNGDEIWSCGDSFTITSDTVFVAIWTNIYRITYNANGGSGAPDQQIKWQDEDLTLSTDQPTWPGHTFYGWGLVPDRDASRAYVSGGTYKNNESVTLYAVWRCFAYFYSNGELYRALQSRIGGSITCPSIASTETKVLECWQKDQNEKYQPGASLPITQDVYLYAVWADGYKLIYDGNNADGGTTPSPPLALTYTISKCGFYRNGFYFLYWAYADEYDQTVIVRPGDKLTPKAKTTLYAQWKKRVHFHWHGNEETDNALFAPKKRIDLALTATAWNSLYDFINDVRKDINMPTVDFDKIKVKAGDEISANKFNIVSNAIKQIVNAGYGTVVPATVSPGDEIVTTLFNGRGSLKDAINKAVDEL